MAYRRVVGICIPTHVWWVWRGSPSVWVGRRRRRRRCCGRLWDPGPLLRTHPERAGFTFTANTFGEGVGLHRRHPQSPIRIFRAPTPRAHLGHGERLGRRPRIFFLFFLQTMCLASTRCRGTRRAAGESQRLPVLRLRVRRSCTLWVWAGCDWTGSVPRQH